MVFWLLGVVAVLFVLVVGVSYIRVLCVLVLFKVWALLFNRQG